MMIAGLAAFMIFNILVSHIVYRSCKVTKNHGLLPSSLAFLLFLHSKSEKMTTLYLVRHGETVANAAQILQGQRQGQLNENGIRQAEETRDRLLKTPIDAFVSSDLKRAIDTCKIIAKPHGVETVVTTPLLRERDWGSFTDCFIPDLKGKDWPEDIESLESLKSRARHFLTWVKETYPDQTVLCVGHGIINKAIQSVFYGKQMKDIPKMGNAEVRILKL
jgi:probable phosphoglycerate mutase